MGKDGVFMSWVKTVITDPSGKRRTLISEHDCYPKMWADMALYWLEVTPNIPLPTPFLIVVKVVEVKDKSVVVVALAGDDTCIYVRPDNAGYMDGLCVRETS
jgi:hypothetical protein